MYNVTFKRKSEHPHNCQTHTHTELNRVERMRSYSSFFLSYFSLLTNILHLQHQHNTVYSPTTTNPLVSSCSSFENVKLYEISSSKVIQRFTSFLYIFTFYTKLHKYQTYFLGTRPFPKHTHTHTLVHTCICWLEYYNDQLT